MAGGMRPLPEALVGMPGLPKLEGEDEATAEGVTYRRGEKVRLLLGKEGSPHDGMLDGRTATIERILWDVDDKLYLGVTIDGDPGQELLRETGRHLFFFVGEVELV
jgi:Ribonuclease G/E